MHKTHNLQVLKYIREDQSLLWHNHEKHHLLGCVQRFSVHLRMKTNLLGAVEDTRCSSYILRVDQSSNSDIMDYEELACIWGRQRELGSLGIFKATTWEVGELVKQSWNEVRRKTGEVNLPEKEEGNEDSMREWSCLVFLSFSCMWLTSQAHRLHRVIWACMYVCLCFCL